MDYNAVLKYFENSAETGDWNSLYNPKNPLSYSFLVRLQKAITLAGSFENKNVLDLGCGTGALIPFVIDDGGRYIGLDASKKMLDGIEKKYSVYFKLDKEKVSFMFGDIRCLQLPDNMDIIIGLGFIEYFDNPRELIQKLYDKLPKGGSLILSFPNIRSLDYGFVQLLSYCRRLARILSGNHTYQPPHKLWSVDSAKSLYAEAGFRNIKIMNYNVNIFAYPVTRLSMHFTNFWAKILEYSVLSRWSIFATGFLISGEKQIS